MAAAQGPNCEAVLIPTQEQTSSDFRTFQSYWYLNAETEYDKATSGSSSSQSGSALIPPYFAGEFSSSSNKAEFSERVRSRLRQEGFTLEASGAHSYMRRGLDDAQIAAWRACVNGPGGLLLAARNITAKGFNLVVTRTPPMSASNGRVTVDITGGHLTSRRTAQRIQESTNGAGTKTYQILRDANTTETRVTANYRDGFSDQLVIQYDQPAAVIVVMASHMAGGYVRYDQPSELVVSATSTGGPSENVTFTVTTPRAGTYDMQAMWAAGTDTELWVYTPPPNPGVACWVPTGSNLHYFPASTGGWDNSHLSRYPLSLGHVTLPAGQSTILVTQYPCGPPAGVIGAGRLPSIKWFRFVEQK
jgi:hypothetical protein